MDGRLSTRWRPVSIVGLPAAASGEDIRDFFYSFKISGERLIRNLFNMQLAASPAVLAAVQKAYAEAGLPRHPDKGFLLEPTASFWGVELDGVKGSIAGNPSRMVPLVVAVVEIEICTVGLMQALLRSWVSSMLLARRTLSLLDLSYKLVAGREKSDVVRLSKAALEELLRCCALAPLMYVNLMKAEL